MSHSVNNRLCYTLMIFIIFLSLSTVSAADGDLNSSDLISNELTAGDDGGNILTDDEDFSFKSLNSIINSGSAEVNLTSDYAFNPETDADFIPGIMINESNIVVNGNNHIIDAKNESKIFFIGARNITINNLILKNTNSSAIVLNGELYTNNVEFINCGSDDGGAIYMLGSHYTSVNDKFVDDYAINKGASIYSYGSDVTIDNGLFKTDSEPVWSIIYSINSTFLISNTEFANTTSRYASAIYGEDTNMMIKKSRFINLFANRSAGALGFKDSNNTTLDDCEFINISSGKNGGAIFIDFNANDGAILINNTLFDNCRSEFGGAFLQLGGAIQISNSNFTDNYGEYNGGAVYLSDAIALIEDCIFSDNNVDTSYDDYPTYGGAIFSDWSNITVTDSKFEDNTAINGSAIYCYDTDYYFDDLEFNGNDNNAVCTFFDRESEIGHLNGTDTISKDDINNTFYPSEMYGAGMELALRDNPQTIGKLPSMYDLRDEGLVTPVRNQGDMGACWAFAMYGSLESVLLKAMNYSADFSENNMQNSMLAYSPYAFSELFGEKQTEGGFNVMTMAYLLIWLGAFPHDYDEYDELGKISPLIRSDADVHIQDILIIRYTPGDLKSINNVKEAIYKYGAIAGYLLSKSTSDEGMPTEYFNENTSAEYVPEFDYPNHAIAIAGWDDNFSKENFLIQPPGDGAWIVRNSWGNNWADGGYFYVSYYDKTLCGAPDMLFDRFVVPIIENTLPYNRNYQYDFSGLSDFHTESDNVIYSNKYESYGDDLIAAVGTYFDRKGAEYTIMVEVNDEDVYTQKGVSPFEGYHTVKLDNYIKIKKGDEFRVSIISNTVPLCQNSRVHYQKESSLLIYPNSTYDDLTKSGIVACIKVYTLKDDTVLLPNSDISKKYEPGSSFSVKVATTDGHPVCWALVEFTIDNKIYKVRTNSEGIAIFKIPMLNPGNYTLTASYNNQTINVTVNVNETDKNDTEPQNESGDYPQNGYSRIESDLSLLPSGNPILMAILSALLIVCSGFRRKP